MEDWEVSLAGWIMKLEHGNSSVFMSIFYLVYYFLVCFVKKKIDGKRNFGSRIEKQTKGEIGFWACFYFMFI